MLAEPWFAIRCCFFVRWGVVVEPSDQLWTKGCGGERPSDSEVKYRWMRRVHPSMSRVITHTPRRQRAAVGVNGPRATCCLIDSLNSTPSTRNMTLKRTNIHMMRRTPSRKYLKQCDASSRKKVPAKSNLQ